MSPTDCVRVAIAIALTAVLACAAVSDIRNRKIPNLIVLAVISLFGLWSIVNDGAGLGSGLEAALLAFVVTGIMYAVKVLGAGDTKLFSAVALFSGLQDLPLLAVATAITGGVIAVVSLASRPTRAFTMLTLQGKGDYGRGVPYGVAIAFGGTVVIWMAISTLMQLPWSQSVRHVLEQAKP